MVIFLESLLTVDRSVPFRPQLDNLDPGTHGDPMIWRIGGSKRSDRQRRSPRAGASVHLQTRGTFFVEDLAIYKKCLLDPPQEFVVF